MPRGAIPRRLECAKMDEPGWDAVIWGFNAAGRPFRPSDWADRLAGLTAAFGHERKVAYSPLVQPVLIGDARAVVVGDALRALEPRLFQFLLGGCARQNVCRWRVTFATVSNMASSGSTINQSSTSGPRRSLVQKDRKSVV